MTRQPTAARDGRRAGRALLDEVERAIGDITARRPVVVVDDADRENEGDIIVAASKMTPALMAFMIRHTSGVICVPLPGDALDRLQLPLMTPHNAERMRTAFTISVDARDGVTTGISAEDRARTVRTLVDYGHQSAPRSSARDTSSRSATPRVACCGGPGTPRRPWTWPGWPGSPRPGCSPRW